jgi:hypothetical protein
MKIKTVAFVIGVVLLVVSCASAKIHNPEDIPEEDLITVYVHRFLEVQQVDKTDVKWFSIAQFSEYTVKIPPGVHTLYTRYDNGAYATSMPMPITAQFEQGNTYILTYTQDWYRVSFHIYLYNGKKKGKEVTLKLIEGEEK